MFDLTKFLKDEILEDHLKKPIRIKNDTAIRDLSDKYDIEIKTVSVITVRKKPRKPRSS